MREKLMSDISRKSVTLGAFIGSGCLVGEILVWKFRIRRTLTWPDGFPKQNSHGHVVSHYNEFHAKNNSNSSLNDVPKTQ